MISFFQGYELFLNRTNSTCTYNGNNQIGWDKPVNSTTCSTKCDQDENCIFFFINDASYCVLYKSCENTRTTKYTGSTYKKVKGNIRNKTYY